MRIWLKFYYSQIYTRWKLFAIILYSLNLIVYTSIYGNDFRNTSMQSSGKVHYQNSIQSNSIAEQDSESFKTIYNDEDPSNDKDAQIYYGSQEKNKYDLINDQNYTDIKDNLGEDAIKYLKELNGGSLALLHPCSSDYPSDMVGYGYCSMQEACPEEDGLNELMDRLFITLKDYNLYLPKQFIINGVLYSKNSGSKMSCFDLIEMFVRDYVGDRV